MGKSLLTPGGYRGHHFKSNRPPPDPSEVVDKFVTNYRKFKIGIKNEHDNFFCSKFIKEFFYFSLTNS